MGKMKIKRSKSGKGEVTNNQKPVTRDGV